VQAQVITVQYVPSELQLADFFTKAQTRAHHDFLLSKLRVVDSPLVGGRGVLDVYICVL
jgi:hypothetical protein